MPKVSENRRKERSGVNAVQSLFESSGYVFQEVDLRNDYGKDAYVDLVDGQEVTGTCVALQIKSGVSYRRPCGYGIPLDSEHLSVWRGSTLPIAGIVHDPQDGELYWCNITSFLQQLEGDPPSYIPVNNTSHLNSRTLHSTFKEEMLRVAKHMSVGPSILQLCSKSDAIQIGALSDCFAVARSDIRSLIVVRYLITLLDDEPLRHALWLLASAAINSEKIKKASEWIPESTRLVLKPYFCWKTEELVQMFSLYCWEEWQRDRPGRDLFILLNQDPCIESKLESVAITLLDSGKDEAAFAALYLAVYGAENGEQRYWDIVSRTPEFRRLKLSAEVEAILADCGHVSMY